MTPMSVPCRDLHLMTALTGLAEDALYALAVDGQLLMLEGDGHPRFPLVQFVPGTGQVIPGFPAVIAALTHAGLDHHDIVDWLHAEDEGDRWYVPATDLAAGRVDTVYDIAVIDIHAALAG